LSLIDTARYFWGKQQFGHFQSEADIQRAVLAELDLSARPLGSSLQRMDVRAGRYSIAVPDLALPICGVAADL
jgi:hypothetical protein